MKRLPCEHCRGKGYRDIPEDWADSVRAARRELNMTLKELSGALGCSYSHLSKIERGEMDPSPWLRLEIEAELGLGEGASQ